MLFLLFLLILGFGGFIFIQYRKHEQANELYNQAKELEKKDDRNPYELKNLQEALAVYKQCNKLVSKPEFIKAVNQCQKKIDDRLKFQGLVAEGRKKAAKSYFKKALQDFTEAQKLFTTKELETEIFKCQQSIEQQEKYEIDLEKAIRIARLGRFYEAINLLKPALEKFDREDGQLLLTKLEKVIQAKELYKLGLIAENTKKLSEAIAKYEQALDILPEFTDCKLRLGIITASKNPNQAINYLEEIKEEQATYIRGFAYAQLGKWQKANREWKSILNNVYVEVQRHVLNNLIERDRVFTLWEIENSIERKNFDSAKSISLEFINKFGSDSLVQQNLEEHIQPLLERQIWESQNWQQIATKTQKIWLEQQDISSLHNWAIATYYLSQIDSSKLAYFIIAWSTALANIEHNPILQNVPWLGSSSIEIQDVSEKLKQILENAINAIKDDNLEEYLHLRDIYRRESVALSLVQKDKYWMKINQQLVILPGCYESLCDRFPPKFPANFWGALCTDWGLAVAACHEGDTARAIKIKPNKNPSSEADLFAYYFVSYYEGYHYLKNLEWRKAIKPLQQAKSEIKNNSEWCKEIDRLCEQQRNRIDNFDEHLELSKFWYELLNSQPGKSYFAECKARKVAQKIGKEEISIQQGLKELKKIQDIDPSNPVTLDLIEKTEIALAETEIFKLLKQDRFEEAVRQAKRSRHDSIRFMVAEICIDLLLKGAETHSLSFELMHQLGQWAYELCPREPAFQEIYSSLRISR